MNIYTYTIEEESEIDDTLDHCVHLTSILHSDIVIEEDNCKFRIVKNRFGTSGNIFNNKDELEEYLFLEEL